MKTLPLLATCVVLFTSLSKIDARTWTDATSKNTIEAEFVAVVDGKVQLRVANGDVVPVDIARLIPEDQQFILAQSSGGASSAPGEWPQWRGPNQNDISPDTNLLKEWPEGGPTKVWTFDDAGLGYGGFAISGGTLYTLGTRDGTSYGIAINTADGSELWSTELEADDENGYSAGWGGGPRSTPTVANGKVYFLGVKGTLACLDAGSGSEVWSKNIKDEFGGQAGGWGYSESPVVDGDKVVIAPGGRTAIVALNAATGDVIWQSDQNFGKAEYATIVNTEINGQPQYVKFFEQVVAGFDPEDGSVIWTGDFPNGRTAVIPTPIIEGNEVYLTAGYGAGGKLLRVEAGNAEAETVWENKEMKNHHGGVIRVGDYVYGFSDGPGLICQEWATGEIVWNQKGPTMTKGSIHIADGMIYALNEGDGVLTLVEATPDGYSEKGWFQLDPQSSRRNPQGKVWTHPVVVGGRLYLRDQEFIHSYDVSAN